MLFGTEETEQKAFAERIAATAIVNQAAIKCLINGLPINEQNVVRLIGDFVDPSRPDARGLIDAIMKEIDELISKPGSKLDMHS